MSSQLITLIILLTAIVLFLIDRFPPDTIAISVMVALGLTGVLSSAEAFSGFGRSTIITLIALFILAQGLKQAGWADQIANLLLKLCGTSEVKLIVTIMGLAAFLSLFMNNVAAAAVLLTAVLSAARQSKVSASRLLMPMAFGTILGGAATLLTTTNIVSSGFLEEANLKPFGLLDFLPIGIILVITGTVYMIYIGRKRLPEAAQVRMEGPLISQNLVGTYQLADRLAMARIVANSPLAGKTLAQSGLRQTYKLNLVAIDHKGVITRLPDPSTLLLPDDVLIVEGRIDLIDWTMRSDVMVLENNRILQLESLQSEEIVVSEAVLAPRSSLIGSTLQESRFRERYGVSVLGIWRTGRPFRSELETQQIQFGDALLLYGRRERIMELRSDRDLILLSNPELEIGKARKRSGLTLTIFLATIFFSIIFSERLSLILMAGAVLMVFTGILSMKQAYRSIEWRVVFLVAGMLPLGLAMSKTGLATSIIELLIPLLDVIGAYGTYVILFLLTVVFSQIVHSAVVATIMVPIGIQLAQATGLDVRSLVMGLALATSMTFITPLGHPSNMLVMAPGGYRFKDYTRVGLPLTLLLSVVILLVLPLIWPVFPK
ncbi:MAG: SLC13 family permease [Anaerolineaceae bacterium]